MSNRTRRIFVLILLLTAGCNSQNAIRNVADSLVAQPDPTVDLLESELRWMENNLYVLDDQLETSLRQLESAKRNNAALRLELAQRNNVSAKQASPTSAKAVGSDEPFDEESQDTSEELFDFGSPKIEMGVSERTKTNSKTDDALDNDELKLPDGEITIPNSESILVPKPSSTAPKIQSTGNPFLDDAETPAEDDQVHRIRLNQRLTGGFNFDRKAGHDGIMVVIEPQDAYAQYSPTPGPITVELRDPSKKGIAGQIGKWMFTESEVVPLVKKTLMGKGIHLELPWPNGSPTAKRLELTVAYETPRGKKLTTNQEVFITPTTSALVTQADDAEQRSWYSKQTPTASRWKPIR